MTGKMNKRFKVTTKANPKAKTAPNILQQDFTAASPDQRWIADITYVATAQGWLYVAAIRANKPSRVFLNMLKFFIIVSVDIQL
jgi:transposase InsO family protein